MNIENVYAAFREELPALIGSLLKEEYTALEAPEPAAMQGASVSHCMVADSLEGDFALIYESAHRRDVAEQFLRATVGLEFTEDTDEDAACLELANLTLGHLTETARQAGCPMTIVDPLTMIAGDDFHAEMPAFDRNEGLRLTVAPKDGSRGRITIWARFAAGSAPAESADAETRARVLIVDDSPVMRAFLEKVFVENGYEVVGVAEDGIEAIERFEATRPDLMTLDIIMPRLKGTDVLERIIEKHPDACVVMASSVKDARIVMKCLRMGAKRYIVKPYDREAVLAAAEKALHI